MFKILKCLENSNVRIIVKKWEYNLLKKRSILLAPRIREGICIHLLIINKCFSDRTNLVDTVDSVVHKTVVIIFTQEISHQVTFLRQVISHKVKEDKFNMNFLKCILINNNDFNLLLYIKFKHNLFNLRYFFKF
jgi:hypothetical protein